MAITYNKQKRRWYREDGTEVKYGNRVLGRNGIYYQFNSDGTISRVGSVSEGLDKSYVDWKKKHGQSVNTTLENNAMRSGLIKDKAGKWRLNSTDHSTKTKQINGKSYFVSKDGFWRNFDTGLKISEQQKQDLDTKNKAVTKLRYNNSDESWKEKIKNHGIVGGVIDKSLDELGVAKDSNWRTAASLASTGLYFIPIVGTALSLGDAGLAAARGDWADAAMSIGMGLAPMTRGLKSLKTINKALGNNKVGLMEKTASKIFGQPALSRSQKMVNTLNKSNPTIHNVQSATHYLENAGNPLSRLHLTKKHNIAIGENAARTLELLNNPVTTGVLIGNSMYQTYNKDSKADNQYENQLKEAIAQQRSSDIDSGVIYGRMSNQDLNSLMSKENHIDPNTYNWIREQYSQNLT